MVIFLQSTEIIQELNNKLVTKTDNITLAT
jgi:hypothetical protein